MYTLMVIYYITAYYTMEKQKKKWQQSLQQLSQCRAHTHQMQFNYMPQEYFLEALFPFKNFAKKKSSPKRHSLASLGCLQDRYPGMGLSLFTYCGARSWGRRTDRLYATFTDFQDGALLWKTFITCNES